jgi:hypothetical protein
MQSDLSLLSESYSDLEWFQKNANQIRGSFEGQFVAIKNKKIIAFAPSMQILAKKLKESKVSIAEVLVQYIFPQNHRMIL